MKPAFALFAFFVSILIGSESVFAMASKPSQSYQIHARIYPKNNYHEVVLGDLNGDKKSDLVLFEREETWKKKESKEESEKKGSKPKNELQIFWNHKDGGFRDPLRIPLEKSPYSAALADINGDRALDILVGLADEASLLVFYGDGQGAFSKPKMFSVKALKRPELDPKLAAKLSAKNLQRVKEDFGKGSVGLISVGDMDGDGLEDAGVIATYGRPPSNFTRQISILYGASKEDPVSGEPLAVSPYNTYPLVHDFNQDGIRDLILYANYGRKVDVFLSKKRRTYQSSEPLELPRGVKPLSAKDIDRDGYADLIGRRRGSKEVVVFRGKKGGGFAKKVLKKPFAPKHLVQGPNATDINGDGILDHVEGNRQTRTLSVYMGLKPERFAERRDYPSGDTPDKVYVKDLYGDAMPEVVVWTLFPRTITILGMGEVPKNLRVPVTEPATRVDYRKKNLVAERIRNFKPLVKAKELPKLPIYDSPISLGGSEMSDVKAVDLNEDGRLDLVAAIPLAKVIYVAMHFSRELFKPARAFPAGDDPQQIAVGDFNGDGHPDLAVANLKSHDLAVLLGDKGGKLENAGNVSYGVSPRGLVSLPSKGKNPDRLLVLHEGGNEVAVLGDFDGKKFSILEKLQVRGGAGSMALGDLNGDEKNDLVITYPQANEVEIYFASWWRGFKEPIVLKTAKEPISAAIADLNQDQIADLLITNRGAGKVTVYLGRKDSKIQKTKTFSAGVQPEEVAIDDFNEDGVLDLAIANGGYGIFGAGSSNVSIFLGRGNLRFAHETDTAARGRGGDASLVTGDFNQDGHIDLVTTGTGWMHDDLWLALGNGKGGFAAPEFYREFCGGSPHSFAVGDFNRDGNMDLVVGEAGSSNRLMYYKGSGKKATFESSEIRLMSRPRKVRAAQIAGDENLDLLIWEKDGLFLQTGHGDGSFASAKKLHDESRSFFSLLDLDSNGRIDILLLSAEKDEKESRLEQLSISTNGSLKKKLLKSFSFKAVGFAAKQEPKGKAMLLAVSGSHEMEAFRLKRDGKGRAWIMLPENLTGLKLFDLNGDGKLDLVAQDRSKGALSVFLAEEAGKFKPFGDIPIGSGAHSMVLEDLNQDGNVDIGMIGEDLTFLVLVGLGDGRFSYPLHFSIPNDPRDLRVADINNDGILDIITAHGAHAKHVSVAFGVR